MKHEAGILGGEHVYISQALPLTQTFAVLKGIVRSVFGSDSRILWYGPAEQVLPSSMYLSPEHTCYLPMHAVRKCSSSTTKILMVFNGSVKSLTTVSLNDILLVGPTVHSTLLNVLLRFCTHHVALTTDVSHMYRAVLFTKSNRDLHCFVWRRCTVNHWRTTTWQGWRLLCRLCPLLPICVHGDTLQCIMLRHTPSIMHWSVSQNFSSPQRQSTSHSTLMTVYPVQTWWKTHSDSWENSSHYSFMQNSTWGNGTLRLIDHPRDQRSRCVHQNFSHRVECSWRLLSPDCW